MVPDPLVSYVICTFNSEEHIERNLQSIKDQEYGNQEIIVVDNCSSDSTREIIEDNFPEVKLIVMPDSSYGACETFNIGFETSRGKYVAVLDDDVKLPKEYTSQLVEDMEESDYGALIPSITDIGEDCEKKIFTERKKVSDIAGNVSLIRKSVLDEVGYYDKDFFIDKNDYELGIRISKAGHEIETRPNINVKHFTDPSNKISGFRMYYRTRNYYWTYWRHFPLKGAVLYSFRNFYKQFRKSIESGNFSYFVKGNLAALRGIKKYLFKTREPSRDFKYRSWTIQNFKNSLLREFG